jgi:hypothetical protein
LVRYGQAKLAAGFRGFRPQISPELSREPPHQVFTHSSVAPLIEADTVIFHCEARLIIERLKNHTNAADALIRKGVFGRIRDKLIDDQAQ